MPSESIPDLIGEVFVIGKDVFLDFDQAYVCHNIAPFYEIVISLI